jgi:hypothetical protein
MPHLHFTLTVDEVDVDPYAGEFSHDESWWAEQNAPDVWPGLGCVAP